jgi:hypothetical protein
MHLISLGEKTSAGSDVLRATTFASLSALVFLDCSMYSTVKPLKWFSILLMRVIYLSRVGFLAMHSFFICPEGASLDPDGS